MSSNNNNKNKKPNNQANQKKKQSRGGVGLISTILLVAVTAGLWGAYFHYQGRIPSLTGAAAETKSRFKSFNEFFPFYLQEHSNGFSRALHLTGSTLVIVVILASEPRMFLSMASGVAVGLIVRDLTVGIAHGFFEFGAMVGTYLLLNLVLLKRLGIVPVIVGYAFAWFGHFYYEKNQPATFIYPVYSFFSDYFMLWKVLTRELQVGIYNF